METPLGITLQGQSQLFLYACIFGAALGVYYDVFRLIRLLAPHGSKQLFFHDVLYFFTSGILTFLFLYAVNFGQVRFYLIAGEIIGWCIYHLTVGALFLRVATWLIRGIRAALLFLYRHLLSPIFHLLGKVMYTALFPLRWLLKILKKLMLKVKIVLKRKAQVVYNLRNHPKKRNLKKSAIKPVYKQPIRPRSR